MKRKLRQQPDKPFLQRVFKGESLEGYVEASRTKTLDQFGESQT